jgi:iron complex transport system substrate-binding protein
MSSTAHPQGVAIAIALALATLTPARAAPAARPQRVMSLNACTDQLVLMLLPPERIVSVTYLAPDAAPSPEWARKARAVGVNHGLAEEVLAQKPDLVIGAALSASQARGLARAAGLRVLDVDAAESFEDIRRVTRQIAEAAGESARGEALIGRMDADLALLKRTEPRQRLRAIGWDGAGRVPGRGSLFDAILTAAGGVNLGAGEGAFEKSVNLEQLLALNPRPDLLLYAAAGADGPTLRSEAVLHPVIAQAYAGRRIAVPDYRCGTPQAAAQALTLRLEMQRAMRQTGARP